MHGIELIIVLLAVVIVFASIALRYHIPYPMVLLVAGTVFGLTPGLPEVHLEPELVFILFLPPILFSAAYATSWRDFRSSAAPISFLAIGGVLATTIMVAVVAHWLFPDISWPIAFLIGAIVSPPDAVAATAIFERLGVPSRTVTILEGESLVNDASALIAYRFALAAVLSGTFSIWEASLQFFLVAIGGVVLGIVATKIMVKFVIPFITEPRLVIATTLVMPLGIYMAAEAIHVSGVLAVVTSGLLMGRFSSWAFTSEARTGGLNVWGTVIIVINSLVFILMGLQVGEILDSIDSEHLWTLTWQALLISLVVILARFAWIYPSVYIPRSLFARFRERRLTSPEMIFIISWSGLRGIVSLASALAIPLTLDNGDVFPFREETIFITFVVIAVTLLGQGLPLPWILRKLDLHDDGVIDSEIIYARRLAASAVLNRLNDLEGQDWVPLGHVIELRSRFSHALEHLPESGRLEDYDSDHLDSHDRLRDEVFGAARDQVLAARNRGDIGDNARILVEQEIDLEILRKEF